MLCIIVQKLYLSTIVSTVLSIVKQTELKAAYYSRNKTTTTIIKESLSRKSEAPIVCWLVVVCGLKYSCRYILQFILLLSSNQSSKQSIIICLIFVKSTYYHYIKASSTWCSRNSIEKYFRYRSQQNLGQTYPSSSNVYSI